MNKTLSAAAAMAVVTPALFGQCSYTVSMWEAFRAGQPTADNVKQVTTDAFTYRRDGVLGSLLLSVPVTNNGIKGWGEPTQSFNVPLAGPVFSPDPAINQSGFYDRLPAHTGIMLHPGYGQISCTSIFTAQGVLVVSSLDLYGEVVGDISDGVSVTLEVVTSSGAVTNLWGPSTITWSGGPVHVPILPIVPITLQAGDRLVVSSTNAGNPFEDWLVAELEVHVSTGTPTITAQPRHVATCPGGMVTLSVTALGAGGPGPASGYQWQRDGVDIDGAGGPTYTLSDVQEADGGKYRCVVRNTCGATTSRNATLLVRSADVGSTGGVSGADGILDNNDFVVFIDRFFLQDVRADYGAAGGTPGPDEAYDNNDFVVFIDLFFSGCT